MTKGRIAKGAHFSWGPASPRAMGSVPPRPHNTSVTRVQVSNSILVGEAVLASGVMPGAQWPKNGKGGPKLPELCIKTAIRRCTGISQNHHPCLRTFPDRSLFIIPKGGLEPVANVCRGGAKIIVTLLVLAQITAETNQISLP